MARNPKLNALRVFDAAARHLNFREASVELNVTQGAVAQAIRGLEADLGVGLFRRLPRGVALTDIGLRYHLGVARGLAEIDHATAALRSGSNTITVSVPPSFASKWLVPKLPYFLESQPDIEVNTVATETVTDLHMQNVDVVVGQGLIPKGGELVAEALAPLDLIVVGAASIQGPSEKTLSRVEAFADLPLIEDSHQYWTTLFREHGLHAANPILRFNQSALAIDAAISGQGFAVVPRLLADDDLAADRLIELRAVERTETDGFWILHLDNDPPNGAARSSFVAWLLSEAGRRPPIPR